MKQGLVHSAATFRLTPYTRKPQVGFIDEMKDRQSELEALLKEATLKLR